jgi:polyribonucleotide nucleotidyltransferase
MQLLKRITGLAEDEEAIQKRKEEQEERLNQIRVMMDKEKKVREVTVTGGGSELTVQTETN